MYYDVASFNKPEVYSMSEATLGISLSGGPHFHFIDGPVPGRQDYVLIWVGKKTIEVTMPKPTPDRAARVVAIETGISVRI